MKKIILFLFICFSLSAKAGTYYFSSAGIAGNNGTSSAQSWPFLKLNTVTYSSGDSLLLKAGDTCIIAIRPTADGLIFGSYSTGVKPVVSGLLLLNTWTLYSGNIYRTFVPGGTANMNVVTLNGVVQRKGRYPNYNTTDGGWLSYESFNAGANQITDNQLSTTPNNWTGADAVIKKYSYIIDVCPITTQSGGTLTYTNKPDFYGAPLSSQATASFGYFIQNDLRTLDMLGEWWFKPSVDSLYMNFGGAPPSSFVVKASIIDTLFNAGNKGYVNTIVQASRGGITVQNIAFEGGNDKAIYFSGGSSNTVKNCSINNCTEGIYMWYDCNLIDSDSIINCLSTAIQVMGPLATEKKITNNYVSNIGLLDGMGRGGDIGYTGINVEGDNTQITFNKLVNIGFNGIKFSGTNILVDSNQVSNYCSTKDDGGAFYNFSETTFTNRNVQRNIAINGVGNRFGRTGGAQTAAYYSDGSRNINYYNNVASVVDGFGFFGNNCNYINFSGNLLYNVPIGVEIDRRPGTTLSPSARCRNNRITNNIIYPTVSNFFYWNGQLNEPYTMTIQQDMDSIGVFDSSYIRNDLAAPFDWYYHLTAGGTFIDPSPMYFSDWATYINGEANSHVLPTATPDFQYNATLSPVSYTFLSNKITPNGTNYAGSYTIPPMSGVLLFPGVINLPPVANAGIDKAITLPINSVFVKGIGTDSDGTITAFTWLKVSGSVGGDIISPRTDTTTIVNLTAGIYLYQFAVTDNLGAIGVDTMQITVTAARVIQPTAYAGVDQSLQLPTSANLQATVTGNISSVSWNIISGPSGSSFSAPTSMSTILNGLSVGIYQVGFSALDINGLTARDTVQITVIAAPSNIPPTVDSIAPVTIQLPINYTSAIAIGRDVDGTVVSYAWTQSSGPNIAVISAASSYNTNFTGLIQGIYAFKVIVTDNNGAIGSRIFQVTVLAAIPPVNIPPTVSTSGNVTITLPVNSTTLSATATDADGSIVSTTWRVTSAPGTYTIGSPNSLSTLFSNLVQGIYTINFKAVDNSGDSTISTLQVTVNPAPVITPPTCAGGTTVTKTLPFTSTILTATATAGTYPISTYLWVQTGGGATTISNGSTLSSTITNLTVAGTYTYQIKVTDNQGNFCTNNFTITALASSCNCIIRGMGKKIR